MAVKESPVFETKNLTKNYGRIKALRDLSLQVKEGETCGILGPNGSGKTTTLSIATGILDQDSGSYYWFGQKPAPAFRKRIGSIIEVPHFYPYLNLTENLRIIAQIKKYGQKDIERVLKVVKLHERRKSRFNALSLGMKQRLGLAAALLGDPEVLVLDEPTNGLDPEGIAEVREIIIEEGKRGKTIIMASHILSEVEKVCSNVVILKNGELIEQGDVKALLSGENLVEVAADENQNLENSLKNCPFVGRIKNNNGSFLVTLENDKKTSDLNSFLFSKGLSVNMLLSHKKSLESQFLELINDDNSRS